MKTAVLAACLIFIAAHSRAQELFVFTEPASNMPAGSLGIRVSNWLMPENNSLTYHLIPELMWGVNKNLMLHAEGFVSNSNRAFTFKGAGAYAKYRFLSKDDVSRHFRMAAFGRVSANNDAVRQEEIETNGRNTGYEAGLVATQLLHKLALSASASLEHAADNNNSNEFPKNYSDDAINYSLSAGRLMLPKEYTSFKQVNMNLMLELIGQTLLQNGKTFIDIAPSLQLIINSQLRIDVAYKQQLSSAMLRDAPNGILFRMEYLLFNIL